jgi:hypothetical protein
MLWEPTLSELMTRLPLEWPSVLVPMVVDPSLKVTVPVEVEGMTVAVSVTLLPKVDGFVLLTRTVVVESSWPTLYAPDPYVPRP